MREVFDDIQTYMVDDYNAIVDDFIDFFSSKYGDTITLYQIGSAGLPSVSDLDLAVIIDESRLSESVIRSIIKDANEFVFQNEARRYIFTHSTLKYPMQTFSYNQYFEDISHATLLHGEEITLKTQKADRSVIDDLIFMSYESNTLRDFERLHKKKRVGLRELLKVYQHAYYHLNKASYHQNKAVDPIKLLQTSEYIKNMRRKATQIELDHKQETALVALFYELYYMVKSLYSSQIVLLSEKITGQRIDKEVFVLGSGSVVKQPLFLLYMGALYAREFANVGNCYAEIHRLMYPLDISHLDFDPRYIHIIRKQAEILKPVCSFYQRFGVKVSGPMLCYYCRPELNWKLRLRYAVQKQLYRLQGLKTI